MSPRPRKSGRRNWPENLYGKKKGGKTYYSYKHPQTGKFHGMGTDFAKASQAARLLNNKLMPVQGAEHLVSAVLAGETVLFSTWLERFAAEILPEHKDKTGKGYGEKTLIDYQRRARNIAKERWAAKAVADVTVKDVASYLDARAPRTSNIDRFVLDLAFRHAKAKGLCDANPATATIPKSATKERQRLDKESFDKIYDAAEPWFQRALDLALLTLQSRAELVEMRFDHIKDGWLHVSRAKVERYQTGYVRIGIGPKLQKAIDACRDELVSPYLIHRRPEKMRREYLEGKDHWSKVSAELLTRTFKKLRDQLKLYDHLDPKQRPTFHEIRSLGGHLYREQGWTEEEIQAIYSHTTEKMTGHYLEGHGIQWVDARGM
ncbi:hypothetical protein CAI21_22340 [Alkalilimnicola ehrlichii]|uniref:Integrase n=1 Tax=Alkalilimnicola ehrlichii TaxID=351052 RepID=A0A3E0WQS2_9GAMM|nr:phage integrase Arm DNA-binding domain-containing protein [Alkalilimnicola ehrlichii]RFA24275.1 hypothetical protein CAI21_22340 [Alkalilimnicola ehrlichii]RFA35178.1 hypothetical protein CAL65_13825 [Alkalilimnicola ehrlichii]